MKNKLARLILLLSLVSLPAFSQGFAPSPYPELQFFSNTGAPLSGGCLFSYIAGTTTLQATYPNSTGSGANQDPQTLDAAGRANVWLQPSAYKFVLTAAPSSGSCSTSNFGSTIWTVDNVTGSNVLPGITNLSAVTLDVTSVATFPNGSSCNSAGCNGMVFSTAATFNGGLTTAQTSNSVVYIGSGGAFYNRIFSGGDANCTGVSNGWLGIRSDTDAIEYCTNGVTQIIGGTAGTKPCGTDTQLQYNKAGACGADSGLTWHYGSTPYLNVLGEGSFTAQSAAQQAGFFQEFGGSNTSWVFTIVNQTGGLLMGLCGNLCPGTVGGINPYAPHSLALGVGGAALSSIIVNGNSGYTGSLAASGSCTLTVTLGIITGKSGC